MQDMLGKPTDAAELIGAVARHVWSRAAPAMPAQAARHAPVQGETAQDGSALGEPVLSEARLAELRENLPPETLAELVEACLADLHERMPALRAALTSADAHAIELEAHAMAGVAGGYGMAGLDARLRAILTAARRGDAGSAAARAGDLERELECAGVALREALRPETV